MIVDLRADVAGKNFCHQSTGMHSSKVLTSVTFRILASCIQCSFPGALICNCRGCSHAMTP